MLRLLTPLIAAAFVVFSGLEAVNAATCPSICSATEVYGFMPGGSPTCLCDSTGLSSCQCSQCYVRQANGSVQTFAYSSDGTCPWSGTDCSTCEKSSSSSSGSSTPTSTPTTTPTSSNTNSNTNNTGNMVGSSSNSGNNSTGNNSSSSSSSSGMQTWQIALIICCAVLVFIVAMSALLSCYCKTRRRLVESEAHAEDANYYAVGASGAAGVGASGASAAAGIDSYGPNQRGGSAVKSGAIYGEPSSYTYTYASSAGSATPSPERAGPGPAYTSRPSSGSVGEATTPYSYRPSQSQAVTL